MISRRKPPQSADPMHVLRQIYDDINSVIDAVNKPASASRPANTEGESGDIRLVKGRHGRYYMQARFNDGWVTTAPNIMQFARSEEDLRELVGAGTGLQMKTAPPGALAQYEFSVSDEVGDLALALAVAL